MRYATDLDVVQTKEQDARATAFVAHTICTNRHLTADPAVAFDARGWSRYRSKSVPMLSTDDHVLLSPLQTAFLGSVIRASILGALDGALRVPLTAHGRIQIGEVTASAVDEGARKPTARIDFDLTGPPAKVVAELVMSAEWLAAIDELTQAAIRQRLVSACAAKVDAALIAAVTAGAPTVSTEVGVLLASISGGAPARPYLIGGYTELLALAPTLRDIRDLGIGIVPTPAASGKLILVDATGLLISLGEVAIAIARHATVTLVADGSPATETTINLWQSNMQAVRSEVFYRFAQRADAAAWAEVGGSPA